MPSSRRGEFSPRGPGRGPSFVLLLLVTVLLPLLAPTPSSCAESQVAQVLRERRPRDVKALYRKARSWMKEGRLADAEAVARYLVDELGRKHYKILNLLGLCLHKQGRRDEARTVFEASLAARPGNAMAAKALARYGGGGAADGGSGGRPSRGAGGGETPAATLFDTACAPLSAEVREARRLMRTDRWDRAIPLVEKLRKDDPENVAVAIMQVQFLQDTGKGKEARTLMDELLAAHPDHLAVLAQEVELLTGAQKLPEASVVLEKALALAPNQPELLRKKAVLLVMANKGAEAETVFAAACKAGSVAAPGPLGDEVLFHYLRGRTDESARLLAEMRRRWGPTSDQRLLEGLVHFKRRERDEAVEAFSDGYRRNPLRLTYLATVVPIFVSLEANHDAVALIEIGAKHFPESPVIAGLARRAAVSTVQEHMMTATLEGPFQIRYPQQLKPQVLQVIVAFFRQAYDELCPLFKIRPTCIQLDVTLVPNSPAAATYSMADDKINVAAIYFRPDPRLLAISRHIVRHEFVHLLHAHRMRAAGEEPAFKVIPLWLIEGVAEHYSQGIETQKLMGFDARKAFRPTVEAADPTIGFSDLNACLGVNGAGARSSQAEKMKSYAQACKMVGFLASTCGEGKDVDTLVDFTVKLLRTGDLPASLKDCFGLSVSQFNEGWKGALQSWAMSEDDGE